MISTYITMLWKGTVQVMRAVDLFAGCGGLSLGFQEEGFEIVGAFECWDAAVKCYEKNFNHPVYQFDLSDYAAAAEKIKDLTPDIIIGGPPCQDFSHAGKRVEADRANLTESYSRIIAEVRPKYFVMENVDRARNSQAYANAREIFKNAGYGLTEMVLDASKCGTPQKRKRFICFGVQGVGDGFAVDLITESMSKKSMTLREYFGDKLGFEYYYRHPRNYSRRGIFSIDEPAPTMRGVNRPVPKGYPGHPNDPCPVSESLHALTTKERALIQTFPDDYEWVGNKTDVEQMIGNAVPVNLARFIAKTVNMSVEKSNG
jgi:DNA (cytosine-5)-methyltransferase 1